MWFYSSCKFAHLASNQARFDDLMSYSRYREIRDNVQFYPYEKLVRLHTSALVTQADDI